MRESLRDYPKHYWFYTNIPSVDLLIKNVYILGSGQDNRPLKWMKPMLNVNMRHRPIAQILIRVASSQANPHSPIFPSILQCFVTHTFNYFILATNLLITFLPMAITKGKQL
jgi:hypothetical protein